MHGISLEHLRKVVRSLSQAGYVQTERGRTGGMRLARDPERIRIGDVVRELERDLAVVECFDPARNTCVLSPACGLKGALGRARDAFLATLDAVTLADLAIGPEMRSPAAQSQD